MFTALTDVHWVLHAVACFTTDDTSIMNVRLSFDATQQAMVNKILAFNVHRSLLISQLVLAS